MKLDLHLHTAASPRCGWMPPEDAVQAASRAGLDAVAVTDHNTTEAVPAVREAAPDDLLVVAGEEVDTPEGQIVGLFLTEPVEPGQPPADVLAAIHDQGGLAYAPHPFDPLRERLETLEEHAPRLDAVEVRNGRCVRRTFDDRAAAFASRHSLPGTGGSDAHFAREVGGCWTRLPDLHPREASREDVREALRDGDVEAGGAGGSVWNHAGTKAVKLMARASPR